MDSFQYLEAFRQMLRIRMVEERLVTEYLARNIRSFVHFYIGQEAIAVGVCMNLRKEDLVFSTHRSHGHYLAKGGDLRRMVAELFGKETGCSRGRGGSMHLIDKSVGFMGSISILASVAPIAAGAAYALKKQGRGNISVVFVGDGAADEGGFYESVNLAALMEVPVLFVIENNLYAGMSPGIARHPKIFNMSKIASGLGANYIKTHGNSWPRTFNAVHYCIDLMEQNQQPGVIEFHTFRHMAHSGPLFDDDQGHRIEDPLEVRQRECPVARLRDIILKDKLATEQALESLVEPIEEEIEEALKFAEESPHPSPDDLLKGVYYG